MPITLVLAGSQEDRTLLRRVLDPTMPDARIDLGTDGHRALELVERTKPDAVVFDPAVPGLTGPVLVGRLFASAPQSPIICWTANPDVDSASELFRAGAAAYLLKLDDPAELARDLRAVLGGGVVIAPRVAAGLAARFTQAIHREVELTRALVETTRQLHENASSKDAFIANVNYELRTPVTIVKGIAHLLKSRDLTDEEHDRFVERMDAAVQELT